MNLFDVQGRSVLITGASRGIGRALALGFRDQGAIVYGTGSRLESVEWMAAEGLQGRAADVALPGTMDPIIEEIRKKHGRLDCLINNAGIAANTPASGFKEDDLSQMVEINFKGVFRACQAYYKAQRKDGGNIINLSSVLGMVGTKLASVYCGTKGAVLNMTRALALEWSNSGFRVNAICPGFIETDMTAMIKARPAVLQQMEAAVPLGRLGRPDDLLGAAVFLASDASRYVTGQAVTVDGGYTAM